MAPWIPRLHLFEVNDQPWFPSFLRAYVQTGLTHAWTISIPVLQSCSAANLVAKTIRRVLGSAVSKYTYIDFCAGAGGPTPFIEQALNRQLESSTSASSSPPSSSNPSSNAGEVIENQPIKGVSYAAVASVEPTVNGESKEDGDGSSKAVKFILTDLHPHISSWEVASSKSEHLSYVSEPVDATDAPVELIQRHPTRNGKVFRLFNLAFHHFDDNLARAILKNTVETSDGFGIFELQSRNLSSIVSCFMFGFFIMAFAPLFYWNSPQTLFFVYVMPIVPFVLVFDGLISSLRTRTADEIEVLLRTCGASGFEDWEVRSGREMFLWPTGQMNWVICTKLESRRG
ncbi:Uu.00g124870.m01.CDS01 [Anthostomella pinea]|uniref:Uu.00g124870.m01.CDS01 n=1 Tax=Anthostomella pinea TaxID=933095 RepID=A0AAI8VHK9_9PEZI|nr:Uu.00g124870.m01.CDS01 [Anthostomella pinea]